MFEREARWMLLRFAIMAVAAFVLAIVVPPFLGRMTPARCDAEGGIWDAHNGECQRERMGPRALDLERIPRSAAEESETAVRNDGYRRRVSDPFTEPRERRQLGPDRAR